MRSGFEMNRDQVIGNTNRLKFSAVKIFPEMNRLEKMFFIIIHVEVACSKDAAFCLREADLSRFVGFASDVESIYSMLPYNNWHFVPLILQDKFHQETPAVTSSR